MNVIRQLLGKSAPRILALSGALLLHGAVQAQDPTEIAAGQCDTAECAKAGPGVSAAGVSTTVLTSFTPSEPAQPASALVQGSDGNFYGTTVLGGASNRGTVYRIAPSGAVSILHSFLGGNDGENPVAGLVEGSDGNFYGATSSGGESFCGTLYRITPSGELTVLDSFGVVDITNIDEPASVCPYPSAPVEGADGVLYGMAGYSVYSISPDGQAGLVGDTFRNSYSAGGLIRASDGSFYGTTNGAINYRDSGSVFRYTPGQGRQVLHNFAGGAAGSSPQAALVEGSDGSFYGTTARGGTGSAGTVFRITPAGELTVLHSFASGAGGARPEAALLQGSDGNFYGTTTAGGASNFGTVYRITPAGALTVLYSFPGGNGGATPRAPLSKGNDGNLYGTASTGGESDSGLVFRISEAGTLTVVHSFRNESGTFPEAAVVEGNDGNFYGTTPSGGRSGSGTVYRITAAGTLNVLHSFDASASYGDRRPDPSALIQGNDGNFYGTTYRGGSSNWGTLYQITPTGEFELRYGIGATGSGGSSSRYGRYPRAAVIQGSDGSLYGTTQLGGRREEGIVFRFEPSSGVNSVLHDFRDAIGEGREPRAALIQGNDGSFYGTTTFGGASGWGSIYRITAAGEFSIMHSFASDVGGVRADLVQASDGSLYGATPRGGESNSGILFRFAPTGEFSELHAFAGGDGGATPSDLILGNDGNLYGTTSRGGTLRLGTVFRITPAGEFSVLHNFGGEDGASPSGLSRYGDRDFLVTASAAGPQGAGAIVRITQTATPTPPPTSNGGGTLDAQLLASLLLMLGSQWVYRRYAPYRQARRLPAH